MTIHLEDDHADPLELRGSAMEDQPAEDLDLPGGRALLGLLLLGGEGEMPLSHRYFISIYPCRCTVGGCTYPPPLLLLLLIPDS